MSKYSVDYSANHIVNTITSDIGIALGNGPTNPGIVIAPDAVFIKPLNLVIMTEDNYNKLKEKENE